MLNKKEFLYLEKKCNKIVSIPWQIKALINIFKLSLAHFLIAVMKMWKISHLSSQIINNWRFTQVNETGTKDLSL
jgi:hypothetical protein